MSKRKYIKKSDYWNKFKRVSAQVSTPQENVEPATMGESYHVSQASYSRSGSLTGLSSSNTSRRINRSSVATPLN